MVGKLNLRMELFKFMLSINVVWPIQTIVIVYGESSFKLFLGGVLAEKTVAAVLIDLGTQLAEIDEVSIMGRYLLVINYDARLMSKQLGKGYNHLY